MSWSSTRREALAKKGGERGKKGTGRSLRKGGNEKRAAAAGFAPDEKKRGPISPCKTTAEKDCAASKYITKKKKRDSRYRRGGGEGEDLSPAKKKGGPHACRKYRRSPFTANLRRERGEGTRPLSKKPD